VMGGFIVGFDTDPENIFDLQIEFIQKAGIPLAMIGTLIALPGTQLYRRLESEGRITGETDGNNTHSMEINFIPRMERDILVSGYKRVIASIYDPRRYFERCATLIRHMPRTRPYGRTLERKDIQAFFRSIALQSLSRYGLRYLKLLGTTMVTNPGQFPLAVNLAIKGYHFFKITNDILRAERVAAFMKASLVRLEERYERAFAASEYIHPAVIERLAERAKKRVRRTYRRLNPELKAQLREPYIEFKLNCETTAYRWSRKALFDEDIIMAES
jgi:transglutaminase-like putative cysteine protease